MEIEHGLAVFARAKEWIIKIDSYTELLTVTCKSSVLTKILCA